MSTVLQSTNTPTAALPADGASAMHRLEAAFPEAVAAQRNIERTVAGLRTGETAVINGTEVTAISLAEAEALAAPDPAVVEKVRVALGYRAGWTPDRHLGETATHLTVWSQIELNEIFERVGGTVTSRQAERSTYGGESTWTATELTLTVQVDGVGPVDIVTDIEDDPEHGYRTDVPVVTVARYRTSETRANDLIRIGRTGCMSDLDADDLAHHVDVMAGARATLAEAGMLHLIGMSVPTWKCPDCGTYNADDECMVCDRKKPAAACRSGLIGGA